MPKKRFLSAFFFSLSILLFSLQTHGNAFPNSISPPPQKITFLSGTFSPSTTIYISNFSNLEPSTKNLLLTFFAEQKIAVLQAPSETSMLLSIKKTNSILHSEGYTLRLEQNSGQPGQIFLESRTDTGLFYGIQTLIQVFTKSIHRNLYIEDFPSLETRGIVEGFYGTPWNHASRLQQLAFYGAQKLNTYIYAPKDDPYHREKWRDPYPAAKLKQLEELIATAKNNHVNFIFAVSPGMDLRFNGPGGIADRKAMTDKLGMLYQLGVRQFAIFFDDIENKNGLEQARFLNDIHETLSRTSPGLLPLLTVPTEYFSADMFKNDGALKPYTNEFSANLAPSIEVMYTGPGVVCPAIPQEDVRRISEIYQRKIQVWWNYPANDYMPGKLALGPIIGMPSHFSTYSSGFIMNPMEQAELSKITLQTGASFAWNSGEYDPQQAWETALKDQYGHLAPAMRIFAAHSSHMENNWANAGPPDAPGLQEVSARFYEKIAIGVTPFDEIQVLERSFQAMKAASETLKRQLPQPLRNSCQIQLFQLSALADCADSALSMVKATLANNHQEAKILLEKTERKFVLIKRRQAKLSEKAVVSFIEQSLAWARSQQNKSSETK